MMILSQYIYTVHSKNKTNSHFSNGLVADKNNFDDDNRHKILSGRCNIIMIIISKTK